MSKLYKVYDENYTSYLYGSPNNNLYIILSIEKRENRKEKRKKYIKKEKRKEKERKERFSLHLSYNPKKEKAEGRNTSALLLWNIAPISQP